MGNTFQSLLDEFWRTRAAGYGSDPERQEVVFKQMEWTMQSMLELLRDRFEAPVT